MSMAHRRLKSPRSLFGISTHSTMVMQVNIMVMNGWLTSFSFHVNHTSHSWDKAISDYILETLRSRSWLWSKGKVIQSANYTFDSLPFHLTSDQQFLRCSYIEIWPWNIQGWGHEWGQMLRSYIIPSIQQMHIIFVHTNRTNHSSDMAKMLFGLEKTHPNFYRKFAKITVSNRTSPISHFC